MSNVGGLALPASSVSLRDTLLLVSFSAVALIISLFPYTTLFRSAATALGPPNWLKLTVTPTMSVLASPLATVLFQVAVTVSPSLKAPPVRSEEHTSELQSPAHVACPPLVA